MSLLPQRRRDTANPTALLRREMERLFEDVFGHDWGLEPILGESRGWAPALDVAETDDAIVVSAEVPGMEPSEIDVTVTGDLLTIKGEKKEEKEEKRTAYHRVERRHGSFERTAPIPAEADPDEISATCKNGVLTVTLPKKEKSRRKSMKIDVRKG